MKNKRLKNGIFDKHEWTAGVYDTTERILCAFNALNVCEKEIVSIKAIGVGCFKYGYGFVPCEIEICEPIVLEFEDGSTFELQPVENLPLNTNLIDGSEFELAPTEEFLLKMSINQIPKEITDGTNHSNFDANVIFRDLLGETLQQLTVQTFCMESVDNNSTYKEVRRFRRYIFWTRGKYGFSITQRGGGWYNFELRNQYHFTHDGIELVEIPNEKIQRSFKPMRQIVIVEGHDGSSYFWIMPVKQLTSWNEENDGIEEFSREEISIEEDDLFEFLYYFLEKYFDKEFEYICRGDDYENIFEGHLEHNIYNYSSVRAMIAEIRTVAEMLRNDFDNPALTEVKRRFSPYTFGENENRMAIDITPEEKNEIIRTNIDIAIDFYERFCRRMESMMEHAPQYDQISFMGP